MQAVRQERWECQPHFNEDWQTFWFVFCMLFLFLYYELVISGDGSRMWPHIQCIVHGHIQLHILWVCVSESGILLSFVLQFSGFCKHLENFHNFNALFAQNAQNECIVLGHFFLSACFISEASTLVSFTFGVDVYTESFW